MVESSTTNTVSQTIKNQRNLVRSDLNLEKWNIFSSRRPKKSATGIVLDGFRVLKRVVKNDDGTTSELVVEVGTKGNERYLTSSDAKLFYLLLDIWENQGRPSSGVITTTANYLLKNIVTRRADSKKGAFGARDKKWLYGLLDNMNHIPITFREKTYETHDGLLKQETILLIKSFNMYFKRNSTPQTEFGITTITLDQAVVDSIKNKNVKPVRKDVLISLKKEISVILYRYLDLMLSKRADFERDVFDLSSELEFNVKHRFHILEDFREACAELTNKDLSTGRIVYCGVEKREHNMGWKLVVRKGKQSFNLGLENGEPNQKEDNDKVILQMFETLSDDDKKTVLKDAEVIRRERYNSSQDEVTKNFSLIDATEQFIELNHIALKGVESSTNIKNRDNSGNPVKVATVS